MLTLPIPRASLPSVALFMPAFNEATNLIGVVRKAYEFFDRADISQRTVIIVDDGSTDETPAVIEHIRRMYPVDVVSHPTNMGTVVHFAPASTPHCRQATTGSPSAIPTASSIRATWRCCSLRPIRTR
jgi:cellulose synthase/poly-beta-1,6-N-acetylglucosamine synthase-like glycosyltransferase